MQTLRPDQTAALDALSANMHAGVRRQVLVYPTGAGKTTVAAHAIHRALAREKCVLFVAHRTELIEQCSRRLDEHDIDHGIIQSGNRRYMPWLKVQVASVQTLAARAQRPKADLIVIDEGHRARADTYKLFFERYPNAYILLLTATPWRNDGRGLGDIAEALVLGATPAQMVDLWRSSGGTQGITPVEGYAFRPPDLRNVRISRGDYNTDDLERQVMDRAVVGEVVPEWVKRAGGKRTVLFAVTINHSLELVRRFREAGVRAVHVDGTTPAADRAAIVGPGGKLETGEVTVVCNVGVLTEGWDAPSVECVSLARPTGSTGLFLQMIGRGRRPALGKTHMLLLDHAGCVFEHGLPDAERFYMLDKDVDRATRRKDGAKLDPVRKCLNCLHLYEPRLGACPKCGHANPRVVRDVKQVEGEAVALKDVRPAPPPAPESVRRAAYDKLLATAASRGFKIGWAKVQYNLRFHHWPPNRWSTAAYGDNVADDVGPDYEARGG